jgi:hypothetical protein
MKSFQKFLFIKNGPLQVRGAKTLKRRPINQEKANPPKENPELEPKVRTLSRMVTFKFF